MAGGHNWTHLIQIGQVGCDFDFEEVQFDQVEIGCQQSDWGEWSGGADKTPQTPIVGSLGDELGQNWAIFCFCQNFCLG